MSDIQSFAPLWGVWNIETLLGEGSFGKVYKARREEFGRTFYAAIKHISIPNNSSETESLYMEGYADTEASVNDYYENVIHSLIDEIELLHKLQGNTNIVAYEDHMIVKKNYEPGYDIFIRMELLKGISALLRETAVTQSMVVRMGIDICSALEVLGQKKLIHRDIKPANIFVNEDGAFKLGDFGVSRILEGTLSGLSKKGTYNFMAPEVYKGEPYNTTIDIYSLGIVIYRLLNGNRAPFLPLSSNQVNFSENETAITRRMSGDALPNPAFADDGLCEIILKACAYLPTDRYQMPAEFKEDLLAYATGKSPRVVPVMKSSVEDTVRPESADLESDKTESIFSHSAAINSQEKNNAFNDQPGQKHTMYSSQQYVEPQHYPSRSEAYPDHIPRKRQKRSHVMRNAVLITAFLMVAVLAAYAIVTSKPDTPDSPSPESVFSLSSPPITASAAPTQSLTPPPELEPYLTQYNGSLDNYSRVKTLGAWASSEVNWDGVYYSAEAAIDTDLTTAWQEDGDGYGIGEYIELDLEKEIDISMIYLRLGFAKSETSYLNNAKPSKLLFEFSDGTMLRYTFPESNEDFYLDTGIPITTSYVRITILGAYDGLKYKDTAITEMAIYSLN